MTLLEQISQLKDDDRVELRWRTEQGWQVSSWAARELKKIVPLYLGKLESVEYKAVEDVKDSWLGAEA